LTYPILVGKTVNVTPADTPLQFILLMANEGPIVASRPGLGPRTLPKSPKVSYPTNCPGFALPISTGVGKVRGILMLPRSPL